MVTVAILLGIFIGLVVGAAACARYLRQEIAANVAPRLRQIERQLDSLHSELDLTTEFRLAALSRRLDKSG